LYNPELKAKIAELETEVEDLKDSIPALEKTIKDSENSIAQANNSLSNKDISQDQVNEISGQILNYRKIRTEAQNEKSQKEYQLEQKQEQLEDYKEEIENYYQVEELYKAYLIDGKIRELKCSLTDKRITIEEDYKDADIELEKYFNIPLSCIERFYTEGDNPTEIPFQKGEVLYSPSDNIYLKVFCLDLEDSSLYATPAGDRLYWNKSVYLNPSALNYWFDFLDTEGELKQFSVRAIGARTKAINENTIKSIYFREVP
jgi:hypothetical protein